MGTRENRSALDHHWVVPSNAVALDGTVPTLQGLGCLGSVAARGPLVVVASGLSSSG